MYFCALQEIQQAADFLEIPFLSKAIAAAIKQSFTQNDHLRSYILVRCIFQANTI